MLLSIAILPLTITRPPEWNVPERRRRKGSVSVLVLTHTRSVGARRGVIALVLPKRGNLASPLARNAT